MLSMESPVLVEMFVSTTRPQDHLVRAAASVVAVVAAVTLVVDEEEVVAVVASADVEAAVVVSTAEAVVEVSKARKSPLIRGARHKSKICRTLFP